MTDEVFTLLAARVGGVNWLCPSCIASGERIDAAIRKFETRLTGVEERVTRVEDREKVTDNRLNQLEIANKHNSAAVDKAQADVTAAIMEELREREEKKLNIILHNVRESNAEAGSEEEKAWDRGIFDNIMDTLSLPLSFAESVRYIRRIGPKDPRKVRPLLVGLRKDDDRQSLLEASKRLTGTDHNTVSIVPDLTQKQREQDNKLREEAKRMNRENLTEDDIRKNLRWVAVGQKGTRRLVKLPSREPTGHPTQKGKNQTNKKRQREEANGNQHQKRSKKATQGSLTSEVEEVDHTMDEESEEEEEPTPGTSSTTA